MRKVERPPAGENKYDYLKISDDLVAAKKFALAMEIDQTSYPYWEKWKCLAKEWNYDPKKLWFVVKSFRGSHFEINFYGLPGPGLHLNTPSVVQQLLHELDLNLGGSLQTGSLIPEEEKQRYLSAP